MRRALIPFVLLVIWWLPVLSLAWDSMEKIPVRTKGSPETVSPYTLLLRDDRTIESAEVSLKAAALSGTLAGIFSGFLIGLFRLRHIGQHLYFKPTKVVTFSVTLGLCLPELVTGLGMIFTIKYIGLMNPMARLITGQSIMCLAACLAVILKGSRQITVASELAAIDLGANHICTLLKVTMPLHKRLIIVGAVVAFFVSFEDYVIAFFVTPPGWITLPIRTYGLIRQGSFEEVYAIGFLFILVSLVMSSILILLNKENL